MQTATDVYELPQEHVDFRDTIRQIVAERVAPRAAEIDETAEYPWDIRKLFAEQDLLGLPFATEYGGTGTGTLMLNVAIEEVAKACASSSLMLAVQDLGTLPIRLFGSEELKPYAVFPWGHWGDWDQLAERLFLAVRYLDERGVGCILAPLPDDSGMGAAVRDRLQKAAR